MSRTHFPITVATISAGLTWIVGQLVAFIPSLATYQSILISAGSAVIVAVFLVANAVHHLAANPPKISIGAAEPAAARIFDQVTRVGDLPAATPEETLRAQLRNAGMEPVA